MDDLIVRGVFDILSSMDAGDIIRGFEMVLRVATARTVAGKGIHRLA